MKNKIFNIKIVLLDPLFVILTITTACIGWKLFLCWIMFYIVLIGYLIYSDDQVHDTLFPSSGTREPGNLENYKQSGDRIVCKQCSQTTKTREVRYPIKIRGLEDCEWASFGEFHCELVRYCPNCDKRPTLFGESVYYGDQGVSSSRFIHL